jgi:hypothetical protein
LFGKTGSSAQLKLHDWQRGGPRFRCQECGEIFPPAQELEFRVRKTFAADVANLRGFSRKIGENPRNLRQKGTWASQAKINSKVE